MKSKGQNGGAGTKSGEGNGRAAIGLAAIIAAAALIRTVFLIQLSASSLGGILPLDMRFYHDLGKSMASGAGLPQGGLTFNPLYPLFLALVFKVFGQGLLVPRIIQCVSGLLTLWLIFHSARLLATSRGGDPRRGGIAGITAASLALLYPQLLLYEGSVLGTSLVTLIMAASFYTALVLSRTLRGGREMSIAGRTVPQAAAAAFLGVLTGAGVMGRPNIFLFIAPLLAGWLFFVPGPGGRKWKLPVLYLAGVIILLAPASIYNAVRTGTPAPVTSHGGINLYAGNAQGARGLYNPPDGMRRDMRGLIEDSRSAAEAIEGRRLTDAEVSAFWTARTRDRIMADPGGWLLLLGRKFLLFWNGGELGDIVDIELMRKECPVLRLLFMKFAIISALAFAGAFLIVRHSPGRWPFLIFLSSSMAAIVLFYFNTRYRLPSVPVLAASAGYFTAWTAGKISERRWKEAAAALAAAALFFAAVPGREMFRVNRSATYTFLGNHYMSISDEEKALEAFAKALDLDPDGVENRINYARVLSRTGDRQRALEYYDLAWKADPDFPRLALEYGYLLDELGMRPDAAALYNHAWNSGRRNEMITAAKLLSRSAYAEGNGEAAIMWVRRALDIAPGDEELLNLLQRLESP